MYRFLLTVSDQGGVQVAQLSMPVDFIVTDLAPSTAVQREVGVLRLLTLSGSRGNPVTALIISGTFRTPDFAPGTLLSVTFLTDGIDFGGASGPVNNRRMEVSSAVVSD